jgi:biotin operon repressor
MYRESNLGLLVKIQPRTAAAQINAAFAALDQSSEGRAGELVAEALDVSYSSLKRHIKVLAEQGITIKQVGKDRDLWSERAVATRAESTAKKARPKKKKTA